MRDRRIAGRSFSYFGKRSKRKLGRALLCLPYAAQTGLKEPSRGSLLFLIAIQAGKRNSLEDAK
jgi:hypothetical protein